MPGGGDGRRGSDGVWVLMGLGEGGGDGRGPDEAWEGGGLMVFLGGGR